MGYVGIKKRQQQGNESVAHPMVGGDRSCPCRGTLRMRTSCGILGYTVSDWREERTGTPSWKGMS